MDGRRFNISLETQLGQMEFLFLQNADFESDKFCPNFFSGAISNIRTEVSRTWPRSSIFFGPVDDCEKKNFFCTFFQNVIDNKPNFIMEWNEEKKEEGWLLLEWQYANFTTLGAVYSGWLGANPIKPRK